MRRVVEFYIGLLGSTFGVLDTILYGYKLQMFDWNTSGAVGVILAAQVIALGLSVAMTKINRFVYGTCMVAIGVMSLWVSVSGLLIPAILEILCGVLVFRKIKLVGKEA
ncbi:hypothetical protein [Bacillus cereus]|uniref:hypothetical protein n=1 Tax=Bacillus cereus TaxID=1396 RepID=UPI001C8C0039|nr:hypothetical protein [Bacillus cereus]MBX9158579.1 hypothetical protein [Bacillus cereus]